MTFMSQPIPQEDLEARVLATLAEADGPVTIHDVKTAVRAHWPDQHIRLYVITATLLALSGKNQVRVIGAGQTRRYARRS
jgi:hypothetical protein